MWLGKLTTLTMAPLGWQGRKNLNTNKQYQKQIYHL